MMSLPMTIDTLGVDQNLQAIRTIEGSWGLPALPNDVALDLAASSLDTPSVTSLLTGVRDDIEAAERRQPVPVRDERLWRPDTFTSPDLYPARVDSGLILSSLAGQTRPVATPHSPDSGVVAMKRRLVDGGYLDIPDSELRSGRWLPEYSNAVAEMSYDELQAEFSGDKPGSISTGRAFELLDQWLSPRGLWTAAINLDLVPDIGAIGREFETWGDKWRKFFDEGTLGSLVDAATGPVDDILFPVLNWYLLLTGVGSIATTTRAALSRGSLVAAQEASTAAVAGLYSGGRGLRYWERLAEAGKGLVKGADGATDVARLSQPGFLASKLAPRADDVFAAPFRQGVSDSMMAWRSRTSVIAAKKTNQQLYRMGLTANLQALVDKERGGSIGSATGVDEWVHALTSNPAVEWGVDLLLTPTNIWERGSFRNAATLLRPQWTRVAKNEQVVAGASRAVGDIVDEWLDDRVTNWVPSHLDASARQSWIDERRTLAQRTKEASKDGEQAALRTFFDMHDDEELGQHLGYITLAAATDAKARRVANLDRIDPGSMDTTQRGSWWRARDEVYASLRYLDEDDLDGAVEFLAKYGELAEAPVVRYKAGEQFRGRIGRQYEQFLEPADVARARNGAVRDDHVRLYQVWTESGPRWTPDRDFAGAGILGHDPAIIDIHKDEFGRLATDGSWTELTPALEGRARVQKAGQWRYLRESEAADMRVFEPEMAERLRGFIRSHNTHRHRVVAELMAPVTPNLVSAYIYDTVTNHTKGRVFFEAEDMVYEARLAGQLDNVEYVTPTNPLTGSRLGPLKHEQFYAEHGGLGRTKLEEIKRTWGQELSDMLLDLPKDERLLRSVERGIFAPLAREVHPGAGRFTVASAETASKQEAVADIAAANYLVRSFRKWRRIADRVGDDNITLASALEESFSTAATRQERLAAIAELRQQFAISQLEETVLMRGWRWAQKKGVSLTEVTDSYEQEIWRAINHSKWSDRYGIASAHKARAGSTPADVLERLSKELRSRSNFMAAEVTGIPQQLADGLAERGYKLVHGVEYMLPSDLMDLVPQLGMVNNRRIRMAKLQSWFSPDPEGLRMLRNRAVKSKLQRHLVEAARAQGGAQHRLVPAGPGAVQVAEDAGITLRLGALGEDSGDLDRIMTDLHDILHRQQEVAGAMKTSFSGPGESLARRFATNVALQRIPFSVTDLGPVMKRRLVNELVEGYGYTRPEADAIFRALMESQHLGFEAHGLYSIETYIRSNPVLANSLRFMGRHHAADEYGRARSLGVRALPVVTGVTGAKLVSDEYRSRQGDDAGILGTAGASFAGYLAGKSLGVAATNRMLPGALQNTGTGALNRMASRLDDKYAWAYLGDSVAQLRDYLRFSLSPIFDASRYSEGMIIGQLEEVPGSMRNLRLNQSPTAWRKRHARQLVKGGMSQETATREATRRWDNLQKEFASAARGDFDFEAIDSAASRFSSVGILGFSPTHWMASTFGNLMEAGVESQEAYNIARKIYTYGTQGRSAAELSTNFVFFPFSFTKKTMTHMANFFTHDIGRAVILTDALAAYNTLSERYDLSNELRDRFPILDRMRRLNVLAYGIGPGRFGGVNAPLIATARSTPILGDVMYPGLPEVDEITNLFIPQAVSIKTKSDEDTVFDLMRQALPIVSDTQALLEDTLSQARARGGIGITAEAEVRRGWDEWRQWQAQALQVVQAQGLTWESAIRTPFGDLVREKRTEISHKYPSWKLSFGDGIANDQALQMELQERLQFPRMSQAPGRRSADQLLGQVYQEVETVKGALRSLGMSLDAHPEEVPPWVFTELRRVALRAVDENPEFLALYNRFYRRQLGDITMELT